MALLLTLETPLEKFAAIVRSTQSRSRAHACSSRRWSGRGWGWHHVATERGHRKYYICSRPSTFNPMANGIVVHCNRHMISAARRSPLITHAPRAASPSAARDPPAHPRTAETAQHAHRSRQGEAKSRSHQTSPTQQSSSRRTSQSHRR